MAAAGTKQVAAGLEGTDRQFLANSLEEANLLKAFFYALLEPHTLLRSGQEERALEVLDQLGRPEMAHRWIQLVPAVAVAGLVETARHQGLEDRADRAVEGSLTSSILLL